MGDAAEAAGRPVDPDKPQGFSFTNPITAELEDCELEVDLPGYRADRVSLKVASVGASNLGTMVLHPISKVGSLTVSATTLQAPPSARKAYDKGVELIHAKKWDAAAAEFAKAVKAFPKFATAWYQLGEARLGHGDIAGAAGAWRESAKADPKFVKPWERLTVFADQKQDWDDSAKSSDAWLQLDPDDFPGAWLYNAIAKARLGRLDEAEHSARQGLKVDKEQKIPRLSYVLGLILLEKRAYVESADCFRTYLKLAPAARDADAVRQQLAEFEKLAAANQAPVH
jgi:superkiller protein 3